MPYELACMCFIINVFEFDNDSVFVFETILLPKERYEYTVHVKYEVGGCSTVEAVVCKRHFNFAPQSAMLCYVAYFENFVVANHVQVNLHY